MIPLCFSLADLLDIVRHHRDTAAVWTSEAERAERTGDLDAAARCRATAVLWRNAADDLASLLAVPGARLR